MTTHTITVPMPLDLYAELGSSLAFNRDAVQNVQLILAIGMFASGEISMARAAEYADTSAVDFLEILNRLGIPTVKYTEEMLADDLAFVKGMKT